MTTPTLIIGAGIAGLWTALKLAPQPVILVTGAPLGEGAATGWAQGGVAVSAGREDSAEAHTRDTIAAGAGLTRRDAAHALAAGIGAEIDALRGLGVPFETDAAGELAMGLEAAHSHPRIAHIKGDQAGALILETLIRAVRAAGHITIRENMWATALLPSADGGCAGVVARDAYGRRHELIAAQTVLATGGYGGLFADTTSPRGATGQAMAMAARLGAEIRNPEFVQFHPTAIRTGSDPLPLATEALRGDGAVLVDRDGHSITAGQDLAARDIVARAVHRALQSGRGAFLDARDAVGAHFPEAFPGVFAACMAAGIDPRTTPIPIAPAAHYTMGGIATDIEGRTTIDGLWAVGECACNGLHGANRLASNSLAEGLVFGHRAARALRSATRPRFAPLPASEPPVLPRIVLNGLRRAMSDLAGVIRSEAGLADLLSRIDRLTTRFGETNEILVARMVTEAALDRTESRGGHYREDYPQSRAQAIDTVCNPAHMERLVAAE
ncbi:L-aspartate oxidase [Hyphobacterium sp. CCMP332]|uniref:L-aspartate oxidase n=1 Tax=Hyphobacterium sp. CCMP332 TaxID=2749086 RepID=UPI00164F032B|nr:L-aspartate oxidase [Hyphobacterium sp. CCMP332]QNL19228.1 L-aspartate oxidase [Hyphobacterium sp. CCMP332]